MGVYKLTRYAKDHHLYNEVDMQDIADTFRSRNIGDPVIAVDGAECTWYLYENTDSFCGGQYKEFRERCECFVKRFHDMGFKLYFFFFGPPVEEKTLLRQKDREAKAKRMGEIFDQLRAARSEGLGHFDNPRRLRPSGVVPCATVTFKELGCEVRRAVTDRDTEVAQFAGKNRCCVGVLSNDSDFLIYDSVPCFFTFSDLKLGEKVTALRFRPTDIASHLGIEVRDLPMFASFMGNAVVRREILGVAHRNLRRIYGDEDVVKLVATLLKRCQGNLRQMCEISFGYKWRERMELVQKSVRSYSCEVGLPVSTQNVSGWDEVIKHVEARHASCEIPGHVLKLMKCRVKRFSVGIEDLSVSSPPTGLVLQEMLARMYVVLLWDSGPGPFQVKVVIPTGLGEEREETVEVWKTLPEGVDHPGLLELWSGPEDDRWRIFTWVISPGRDLSALRALSPQHLVVPAAALFYLYHEAKILNEDELRIFVIVAVSVKNFSARQLSGHHIGIPTERGMYLTTLFVRTALYVLDVAAACGLSFPRPSECHLDAYFDGKLFHHIYRKSQQSLSPKVLTGWDESCKESFSHLMNIIVMESGGTS